MFRMPLDVNTARLGAAQPTDGDRYRSILRDHYGPAQAVRISARVATPSRTHHPQCRIRYND